MKIISYGLLGLWMVVASIAEGASDGTLVMSAAKKGGGYWGVGTRLRDVAQLQGLTIDVIESNGSLQNLQRLDDPDSPVALALTQADALKHYLHSHPTFVKKVDILESIGHECVLVIAGIDRGIDSVKDLWGDNGRVMAIRSPDSGVAATFDYMTLLEPRFKATVVKHMETLEAMERIKEPGDAGGLSAVMLVQRPKVRSPEVDLALRQPEVYRFVDIDDSALEDKLPSGQAVYTLMDITLQRGEGAAGVTVRTICTEGLLLAAKSKLSEAQRKGLEFIIDYQWMRVYPTGG